MKNHKYRINYLQPGCTQGWQMYNLSCPDAELGYAVLVFCPCWGRPAWNH